MNPSTEKFVSSFVKCIVPALVMACVIACVVVATGCSPSTDEGGGAKDEAAEPAGPLNVHGKVIFDGPRPEPYALDTSVEENCDAMHKGKPLMSEDKLVSEDGGLMNVFVSVKNPPEGVEHPIPAQPAVLDQIGCQYTPRVSGIRAGQEVHVTNSDDFLHNVRSFPKLNRAFNLGQPGPGVRKKTFKKAEMAVKIKCDIHPWMKGFMFVMDHPFFGTTDENGDFAIDGLPPGEYTLEAWHEEYGTLEAAIVVVEGAGTEVNFTFKPEA